MLNRCGLLRLANIEGGKMRRAAKHGYDILGLNDRMGVEKRPKRRLVERPFFRLPTSGLDGGASMTGASRNEESGYNENKHCTHDLTIHRSIEEESL